MEISVLQQQIINEFSAFDDWMDKYNLLIENGKDTPMIDARFKTNNHLINGCQSRVWLHAEYQNGKVIFTADSDAVITKGIINLLIRVLSGQSPDDILAADLSFVDAIGLKEHLSPTRSNGLVSMIKQMKLYAQVFKMKNASQ
jgi:cysteine desulfuration protein SufE